MSHWNRRAWNPSGGRYAPQHYMYPVQQQMRQRPKGDAFDSDLDDDGSSSDEHDVSPSTIVVSGYPTGALSVPPQQPLPRPRQSGEKAPVAVTSSRRSSSGGQSTDAAGRPLAGTGSIGPAHAVDPVASAAYTTNTTTAVSSTTGNNSGGSSSRLRTIQQRRIDTLRASGNHAAADIFERAVLKANGAASGAGRGTSRTTGVRDASDDASVLTFATEATDAVSVRYSEPPVQQHAVQHPQRTVQHPQSAAITPTKDNGVGGGADTPETQHASPATPDSRSTSTTTLMPTVLDTSYDSTRTSTSSSSSSSGSGSGSSMLPSREEAELSILLATTRATNKESLAPPPPPPPSASKTPSPTQSIVSTKTSTTATTTTTPSPTRSMTSGSSAASTTAAGFVAISAAAAVAEREEKEEALQQQQVIDAKRMAEKKAAAQRARLAAEEKGAEEERIAREEALAEARRIAEEKKAAAEKARLAAEEEARRIEQERALAESWRIAEEKEAAAKRARVAAEVEAKRIAKERELEKARRTAEEKAAAEKAAVAAAEAEAKAKHIAEEKVLRESTRIAQEKRRLEEEKCMAAAEQAGAARTRRIAEAEAEAESMRMQQERNTYDGTDLEGLRDDINGIIDQTTMTRTTSDADLPVGTDYMARVDDTTASASSSHSHHDHVGAAVRAVLEDTLNYSGSEDLEADLPKDDGATRSTDPADAIDDEAFLPSPRPSSSPFFSPDEADLPSEPGFIQTSPAEAEAKSIKSISNRWGQSARKSLGSKRWGESVRYGSSSNKDKWAEPKSPLREDNGSISNLSERINEATASPRPPLPPKKDDADSFNNESEQVVESLPRPEYFQRRHHRIDSLASHNSMTSSATPVAGIATREVSSLWDRPDTPPATDADKDEYGPQAASTDGFDLESAALGVGLGAWIHPAPEMARDMDVAGSFHATLKAGDDINNDTTSSVDIEVGSMGEVEVYSPKISGRPDTNDKKKRKKDLFMDCDPTSFFDRSSSVKNKLGKIVPARCSSSCGWCCSWTSYCPKIKAIHLLFLLIPIIAIMLYLCYKFFVEPAMSGES